MIFRYAVEIGAPAGRKGGSLTTESVNSRVWWHSTCGRRHETLDANTKQTDSSEEPRKQPRPAVKQRARHVMNRDASLPVFTPLGMRGSRRCGGHKMRIPWIATHYLTLTGTLLRLGFAAWVPSGRRVHLSGGERDRL